MVTGEGDDRMLLIDEIHKLIVKFDELPQILRKFGNHKRSDRVKILF